MDLAKIAELLGTKTEGDPAFQETEEAQFYTHMLRMDDVDNRAVAVQSHSEQVSEEIRQDADSPESEPAFIDANIDTVAEPAETESVFVAPDADPSQALIDNGEDARPVDATLVSGEEATAAVVETEAVENPDPALTSPEATVDAEPARTLLDEQVLTTTMPESSGEATMIVPESLVDQGFMDVWKVFEQEVQRPDITVGEIPSDDSDLTAGADELQSSTEGAESMLARLSRDLLSWERRG